jgi:hypothetical protein
MPLFIDVPEIAGGIPPSFSFREVASILVIAGA